MTDQFYAKNGQFCLNGKPEFIQAGEFHYFRSPQDQWENRLNLLKQAGFNAVASYIPWRWHQVEEGTSDFDGNSHPLRNLTGFLDLAAEMGFYIIVRPGPYIMAETTREGIPDWVFTHYPRTAFISQDGKTQNVVSYLHPEFQTCVRQWYQAVFQVLAPRQISQGGKIIMTQLDNEMGMIAWVRNIIDINPDTLSRMASYLREVYGHKLSGYYPIDSLEEFLLEGLVNPQHPAAHQVVEDYRRFYRTYLCEYASFLWSEAQANGMDVPPVINIHGFFNGGKTFPIGISQLIDVMRIPGMISATDVYPGHIDDGNFHQLLMLNEMVKTLQNPEQPLFSIEFQAGGYLDFGGTQSSLYDLHSRLSVSVGMRAINHYLFFGGENDALLSPIKRHDWGPPVRVSGGIRRHFTRYSQFSSALQSYCESLITSKPQTCTTIGFQLDNFMTEVNTGATQEETQIITHQREQILFDFIAKGLAITHRPFDAIEISQSPLDPTVTPLLWLMMDRQCDATTQKKLVEYVQQGGKLVIIGRMCLEQFDHTPVTLLRDALRITDVQSDPHFVVATIQAFNHRDVPVSMLETYTGEFDEIFATTHDHRTVGFIQSIGSGKVLFLGASISITSLDDVDLLEQMAQNMGCPQLFSLSDWVDIRMSCGDRGNFLFVNNYQDDPITTTVEEEGKPLFGGTPITLAARTGLILPIEWEVKPGIVVNYTTAEIRDVHGDKDSFTLKTNQLNFTAELTLNGYHCDQAEVLETEHGKTRVRLQSRDGQIILSKDLRLQ
jgi:beta-galactosidase